MRKIVLLILILTLSTFQLYSADWNLTAKTLCISSQGGEKQFKLSSDAPWKLTASADWFSVSPSSGEAGKDILVSVKVQASKAFTERKGVITFTADNAASKITLSQVDERNYWKNGDVITLHKHGKMPKGLKPIPIVILGDGWDLSDFKKDDGVFQTYAQAVCDLLLQIDIVKDFTDWFDIYAYCAESNQRGKYGLNAFETTPHTSTDFDKLRRCAFRAVKDHPNRNELTYIAASNAAVGGFNLGDYCVLSTPNGQPNWYAYWMAHEYVGHTLGRIPDLYDGGCNWTLDRSSEMILDTITVKQQLFPGYRHPKLHKNGNFFGVNEDNHEDRGIYGSIGHEWPNGMCWNIDWDDDPAKCIWHTFVGRKGYDNVGSYPAAFNTMFCGLRMPEEFDCMRNTDHIWYNVGTRMWLWNKILERAGVDSPNLYGKNYNKKHPRSLENFIKFDAKHGYNNNGHNTSKPVEHPILTDKYWKDNGLYPESDN